MGFFSFLGRVLFASIFILSAWQMFNEFGVNGGPAAKEFAVKVADIEKLLPFKLAEIGIRLEARHLVAASIALKGLGGLLFVFGNSFGAYLLITYLLYSTPILYNFYSYKFGEPEFFTLLHEFVQSVALFGALLFFMGMKNSLTRRQLRRKTPKPKAA